MRVKPGATVEETERLLAPDQKKILGQVTVARGREGSAVDETRELVRVALAANVPARVLADRLNVSLARVYQMRDEATAVLTKESV